MVKNPAELETLRILPEPRSRMARPAAPLKINTARIITSIP